MSMSLNVLWSIALFGNERKPNYCVVCMAILHELGAQQCYIKPKVECDAAGSPKSGVWPYAPHIIFLSHDFNIFWSF